MNSVLSRSRTLLLAAIMAGVFAAPWPVAAQQAPASPGTRRRSGIARGGANPDAADHGCRARPARPRSLISRRKCRRRFPPPPTSCRWRQLKLPKNFHLEVFASGVPNARSLRVSDKGTVFVSTRTLGRVYALVDNNGKREVKTLATGLNSPNGIALHNGTLYIAEIDKISKIDNIESQLDNPPKPTVIYSDLPNDAPHGWKFLTVGPDNKLYFNIGAPCNICMPPPTHAQIRRINLDGSGMEVVARGIRQIVGMDWHPVLKQMYFTENQRDWLSEDEPNDKLNRLAHPGQDNFGYPYCDGGDIPDPQFGWGHSCNEFTKPVAQLGPHSAPLGLRFYTGPHVPARIRQRALHRAPRLVEQDEEDRRRHRRGEAQRRRIGEVDPALHHRLSAGQQICRQAGRRGADEGRLDADLGRLERRGLSPDLRLAARQRTPLGRSW